MTEQIKNAIETLKEIPQHIGKDCDGYELRALRLAINSLQSWEEVLQELEELKQNFKNDKNIHEAIAVNISIQRIKEHLAEIEE